MRIEYHPSLVSDLNAAISYYSQLQPNLGDRFRMEVYEAISRIKSSPRLYPEIKGVRRALLTRYPYSIVYRLVDKQTIRILLIRHHRRHPEHESGRG